MTNVKCGGGFAALGLRHSLVIRIQSFVISFSGIACYKIRMAAPLKIGFLGAGKMATALAKGFINARLVKANQLFAADPFDAAREHFTAETGARSEERRVGEEGRC